MGLDASSARERVSYTDRDAILYALAVGASPDDLDLVWEERLRVLPSFGLTLAQWAPDILAEEGAFGNRSVHGSQWLEVRAPLPVSGDIQMSAHVGNVWDKGSAAIFEVVVDSDYFSATWSIFAPGSGGFGGQRGPSSAASELVPAGGFTVQTARIRPPCTGCWGIGTTSISTRKRRLGSGR
ncbi:MAG: hypothetical protein WDM88_07690 [Galbitalea sp.]